MCSSSISAIKRKLPRLNKTIKQAMRRRNNLFRKSGYSVKNSVSAIKIKLCSTYVFALCFVFLLLLFFLSDGPCLVLAYVYVHVSMSLLSKSYKKMEE